MVRASSGHAVISLRLPSRLRVSTASHASAPTPASVRRARVKAAIYFIQELEAVFPERPLEFDVASCFPRSGEVCRHDVCHSFLC